MQLLTTIFIIPYKLLFWQLSGYLKSSKVRQVLADLALSQVAHKRVEYLNMSEARRLSIGIQLVRDPGKL